MWIDGIDCCSEPHIDMATAMDNRVFPTVLCHRPGVDMTEGTRGEWRKGPGHPSGALTGFGGVDGKVLILKILGISPNSKTVACLTFAETFVQK
jgi:hypothetical protein